MDEQPKSHVDWRVARMRGNIRRAQEALQAIEWSIERAADLLPVLGEHKPGWSLLEDARCTNEECRLVWPCPAEKIRRLKDDVQNLDRPRAENYQN